MDAASDAARTLLDGLAVLEDSPSGRLHLELLHHLVVTSSDDLDLGDERLVQVAVRSGVPGGARLVAHLVGSARADRRSDLARRCLEEVAEAPDRARAGTLVAVTPHLASPEPAAIVVMGLTSVSARIAGLLALGREPDARQEASGELRARVLALVDGTVPAAPPWASEGAWWRALAIGAQLPGELSVEDRAEAVAALVGIQDGAWHLLLLRAHPHLASAMAWADRTGEGFLAAVGRHGAADRIGRFRGILVAMDGETRATTAARLTDHLASASGPGPTAAAPPLSIGRAPPEESTSAGRGAGWRRRLTRSLPPTSRRGAGGPPPAPDRAGIVSTGFADRDDPHAAVDPTSGLLPDTDYRFWLEVAPDAAAGSIEVEPVALPADLPARARLTVAVFAYDGELRLRRDATHGVLELTEGGAAVVVAQPGGAPVSPGERRLHFPLTTPRTRGPARLRCSIYHRGVLVQSRVVTAEVVTRPHERLVGRRQLASVVDYRLFRTLDAAPLGSLSAHRASLLLNEDGAGTHGLRFVATDGDDVITRDVSIGEGAIGDQIRMARSALRRISWGDAEEWAEGRVYRYGSQVDERTLTADLVSLASNGARFFQLLVEEVAAADPATVGPPDPYLARDRVAEVLRRPGRIQIALQRGPSHILPAALVYDHWLTDSAPIDDYRLCPGYLAALHDGVPLEQAPCFLGDCPQALVGAELTVVCPSGFWGFRHELGFPVTHGDTADVTEVIAVHGAPAVSVGVSTELTSAAAHVQALRALMVDGDGWRVAQTRQDVLAALTSDDRQVVYLYCHGGVSDNVPYVRLGEVGARPITRLDLANARLRWSTTRPLVVLNGCHTTALDPETAIDFVRFFVGAALASGVIGTEITIFEELGEIFGERFMRRFLEPGSTIGEAVRGARLDLLADGNPLGLVYIPFALAGLKLAATAGSDGVPS